MRILHVIVALSIAGSFMIAGDAGAQVSMVFDVDGDPTSQNDTIMVSLGDTLIVDTWLFGPPILRLNEAQIHACVSAPSQITSMVVGAGAVGWGASTVFFPGAQCAVCLLSHCPFLGDSNFIVMEMKVRVQASGELTADLTNSSAGGNCNAGPIDSSNAIVFVVEPSATQFSSWSRIKEVFR